MSSIQNPTATETETQKQEEVPVTNNAMEVDPKVSLINELFLTISRADQMYPSCVGTAGRLD